MRVTAILDLAVLALLAVVLLMPRPDVKAKPAMNVAPEKRERVAELQAELLGAPGSLEPSYELANIFLDAKRPDWALAVVGEALANHRDDYRLHSLRAIAFADRFEAGPAFESVKRALLLCETPAPGAAVSCGEGARSRLLLLRSALESVADIDMRKDPHIARERIMERLRPVFLPKPKPNKPSTAPPAASPPP